jgi:hypothetical protein
MLQKTDERLHQLLSKAHETIENLQKSEEEDKRSEAAQQYLVNNSNLSGSFNHQVLDLYG